MRFETRVANLIDSETTKTLVFRVTEECSFMLRARMCPMAMNIQKPERQRFMSCRVTMRIKVQCPLQSCYVVLYSSQVAKETRIY